MSEMVERVARELRFVHSDTPRDCVMFEDSRWLRMARAAIEAMREPTRAMLTYEHDHMMVHASCHMCGGHLEGWRLMIDAALAEGEEG